jgi:hypothetical protein
VTRWIPETDKGKAFLVGLVCISIGLAIGLPPLALWGPGAALAVPGGLLLLLAFIATPPPEADA